MLFFGNKSRLISFALFGTAAALGGYLCFVGFGAFSEPLVLEQAQTPPSFETAILVKPSGDKIMFQVEIADTPLKSMKGLMFRTSLPENQGMVFIAPKDQVWTMWMKNTLIPLDMVFFKRDGEIVKIISNARPQDLSLLSSDIPVAGVLEISGGVADKSGVQTGDYIFGSFLNKD